MEKGERNTSSHGPSLLPRDEAFISLLLSSLSPLSPFPFPAVVSVLSPQSFHIIPNSPTAENPRYTCPHANVAELADAQDLGSCGVTLPGSTPGVRIRLRSIRSVGLRLDSRRSLQLLQFLSPTPESPRYL
jgi:hypothetical protein